MEQISPLAAAMKFTTPLPDDKRNLTVIDAATDVSASRLAVGYSDGSVSIYSGEKFLNCEGVIMAHDQSVVRVAWIGGFAHGYTIGTSGLDAKVCVFRDVANIPAPEDPTKMKTPNWQKLFEAGLPSICPALAWSPPQYGLILAAACGDGTVAVFSSDPASPSNWIQKTFLAHEHGCTALSWAPCLAPSAIAKLPLVPQSGGNTSSSQQQAAPLPHPRIATGGLRERTVKVWKYFAEDREWAMDHNLNDLPPKTSAIRDIAWAPNVGLPFTTLAACTDEGDIIVWRQDGVEGMWQHHLIGTGRPGFPVSRLYWSAVGSVLISSWRDGQSAMWLEGPKGDWKLAVHQS